MNTLNKPELLQVNDGVSFKVLQITGKAGMKMPMHYATKEVVIIVQKGSALLSMPDKEYVLKEGDHFIIPAIMNHHLLLKTDFEAIAVMLQDSTIKF